MITVLLTLVVMSVVAAVAVKVSLTDRQATWAVRDGERASYASEAGVHRLWANWPAKADSLAPGDSLVLGWQTMADGWRHRGVLRRVDSGFGPWVWVLRIEGRSAGIRGGQRVVELWSTRDVRVFRKGIGARGDILIDNDAIVDSWDSGAGGYGGGNIGTEGDIHGNGDVTITNNSTVSGEASAAGTVTENTGGVATEGTQDGAPPAYYPSAGCPTGPYTPTADMPAGPYAYADASGNLTVDNKTLELPSGTYYFNNVTVQKGSGRFGPAPGAQITVYIAGSLTVTQSAHLNSFGVPSEMVVMGCGGGGGQFLFDNNSQSWGAFYAPDRDVVVEQDADVFGALVGQTVTVWKGGAGPVSLHYDTQLREFDVAGPRRQIPRAWTQIAR
jgi:hypothetical protein